MINTVYRLVQPRRFELEFTDINAGCSGVLVRPTHLSICNADQRYYQGTRDPAVLAKKLPMALIHEAVGSVVYDPTHTFDAGDNVVMIPNMPTVKDDIIAENYLRSSRFRSSGLDGFMQELVCIAPDRVIKLPDGMSMEVAAFTELVSVAYHAVSRFCRFSHSRRDSIGVWGDGNLSYLVSLILKKRLPESTVSVFGVVPKKLADFTFVDNTFLTTEAPDGLKLDHAFECVGGNGSQGAINQIIDLINPEGTISILGVSEYPVPINTRMMLEKGLRMFGSSRSGYTDFRGVVDIYADDAEFVELLNAMIYSVKPVSCISDMNAAFELDASKPFGKTVMRWEA